MNKYTTLIESTMQRFTSGGFLTGDLVKLKGNAMTHEWAKKQPSNLLQKLKEFSETDKHLRVSAVKALRPAVSGSVQPHNQVDDYYCDIVMEEAPGLYHQFITLPAELLEYQEQDINLPELPESLKGKDSTDGEPEELEVESSDDPMNPVSQTLGDEAKEKSMTKDNNTDVINPNTHDNFNTSVYMTGLS